MNGEYDFAASLRASGFVSLAWALLVLVTLRRGGKVSKVCSAVLGGLARRLFGCFCPGVPRPPFLSGTHFEENKGHMREYVCAKHLVGWTGSEVADVVCVLSFNHCPRNVLADRISFLADTGRASTLTTCLSVWYAPIYIQTAGLVSCLSHEIFTLSNRPSKRHIHDCHYLAVLMELLTTS